MSQIKFTCPQCGQKLSGDAALRGSQIECPTCGTAFVAGAALKLASPSVISPSTMPSDQEKQLSFNRYTLEDFLARTEQKERGQGMFELESERMLEVNLAGRVWMKMGAMVAYRGHVRFTREGMLEHGVGKFLKRAVTGEGARLTKAEGNGTVYMAESGKKITILKLEGESMFVNGNDLLAFQDGIEWDIKLMRRMMSIVSGGLFNIRLSGHGLIAITTHYDPLTLRVSNTDPVTTDPNATVAWSGNLSPEFKTDVSFKTFLGRGSGESVQMYFRGEGFVVVQPYEEIAFQNASEKS